MAVSAGELTLFLSANTTSASRNLAAVDKQVTQLASRTPTVNVKSNFAAVTANAKKLNEQLDGTIQRTDTLAKVTFRAVDTSIQKSATLIGSTTQLLVSSINTVAYALKQLSAFSVQLLQLPNVFSRVYTDVQRTYQTLEQVPGFGTRLSEGVGYFRQSIVAAFAVLAPEKFTVGLYEELGAVVVGTAERVAKLAAQAGRQILYANFLGQLGENINTVINDLARLGLAFQGLFEVANALQAIFGGTFDYLIGQNARLQETILSTQTVLASTTKVSGAEGEITDPLQKILALEGPVNTAIENIRRRSLKLAGVTSAEVINIFQTVATNIGAIGGTIKDAEDLAISFTAGLGTLGIPLFQAQQEIGSILTGTVNQDSLLAQRLGITNADIQKARNTTDGVVGYIQNKLKTAVAGQAILATTLSGVLSNFQELFELVGQAAGKPLLTPLLKGLNAIFDQLFRLKGLLLDTAESVSTVLLDGFTALFSQVGASALVKQLRDTYRQFSQQYADRNTQEEQGKRVGNLIKQALLTAEPEKIVSAQLLPVVKVFRDLRNEVVLAAQSASAPLANLLTGAREGTVNPIQNFQKIASLFVLDPEITRQYDTVRSSIQELGGAVVALGVSFAKFKIREFADTIRIATEVILQFGSAFLGAANLAATFFKNLSQLLDLPIVRFFNEIRVATKLVGLSDFVDNLKFVTGLALLANNIAKSELKTLKAFKDGFQGAIQVAPVLGNSLEQVAKVTDAMANSLTNSVKPLNQFQKAASEAISSTANAAQNQLGPIKNGAEAVGQLTVNQRLAALAGDVFSRVVDNVGRNLGYTTEEIRKYKDELFTLNTVTEGFKRVQKGVIAQFLTFQAAFIGLELLLGALVAAFSRYNEELQRTERLNKALLIAKTPGISPNADQQILQLQRLQKLEKDLASERQRTQSNLSKFQGQSSFIEGLTGQSAGKRADTVTKAILAESAPRIRQLQAEVALVQKQLDIRQLTVKEVVNLGNTEREAYTRGVERTISTLAASYDEYVKRRVSQEQELERLNKELQTNQQVGDIFGISKGILRDRIKKQQQEINKTRNEENIILAKQLEAEKRLAEIQEARRKKEQAIKTDKQGQDAKRDLAGIFTGAVEPTVAKIEEVVQKLQERLRSSSPTAPDYMEQVRAVELAKNLSQDAGKSVLDKFVEASQVQADAARKIKAAEVEAADIRRNSTKEAVKDRIDGINEEAAELLSMVDEKRDRELDIQRTIRKSQEDIAEIQRKSWLNQVRQALIIKAIMEGIDLPGQKPVTDLGLLAKTFGQYTLITPEQYKQATGKSATLTQLNDSPELRSEYFQAIVSRPELSGLNPQELIQKVVAKEIVDKSRSDAETSAFLFGKFKAQYADKYGTPYMTLAERKAAIRNQQNPIQIADQSSTLKQLAQVDPLRGLRLEGDTLAAEQNAQSLVQAAQQQALQRLQQRSSPAARVAQKTLRGLENNTDETVKLNERKLAVTNAKTPDQLFLANLKLAQYESYGRKYDRYDLAIKQLEKEANQAYLAGDQAVVDILGGYIAALQQARTLFGSKQFKDDASRQIVRKLRNEAFFQGSTNIVDSLNEINTNIAEYTAGLSGTAASISSEVTVGLKKVFPQGVSSYYAESGVLVKAATQVVTLQAVINRLGTALSNIPQTLAQITSNDAEIQAILAGPQAYEQYKKQKPLLDAVGGADALAAIRQTLGGANNVLDIQAINDLETQSKLTKEQADLLRRTLADTGKASVTLAELLDKLADTLNKAANSTQQLQFAQNLASQDQQNAQSQVDIEAALGKLTPEQAAIRKMEIQAGAEMDPNTRARLEDALRLASVQERIKGVLDQTRQGFQAFFNELGTGFAEAIVDGKDFFQGLQGAASNFFMAMGKYLMDLAAQQAAAGIASFIGKLFSFAAPVGPVEGLPQAWNTGQMYGPAFANGGIARGGFRAFATGGLVDQPTLGLVGEGRYNEAIVPLPDGRSIPVDLGGAFDQNRKAMARQAAEGAAQGAAEATASLFGTNRAAMERYGLPGTSVTNNAVSSANTTVTEQGTGALSLSFNTTRIYNDEFVRVEDLQAALKATRQQAVAESTRTTFDRLRNSPGTRRSVGV